MQALVHYIFPDLSRINLFLYFLIPIIFIYLAANTKRLIPSLLAMLIVFQGMATITYRALMGIKGLQPIYILWLLVFIIIIFSRLKHNRPLKLQKYFTWPLMIFFTFYLIAFFVTFASGSDHPCYKLGINRSDLIFYYLLSPIQILLTGWMVMISTEDNIEMMIVQRGILISGILIGSIITISYLSRGALSGGPNGISAGRSVLGEVLGLQANGLGAMCFYYYVACILMNEHNTKLLKITGIGSSILGVLFTLSRMAWFATIFVTLPLLLKLKWFIRIIIILVMMFVYWQFHTLILNRAQYGLYEENYTSEEKIDDITAGRLYALWIPAYKQISENPLFGTGLVSQVKSGFGMGSPHNAYITVLLDMGLVGLIVVLVLYASFFINAWKIKGAFFFALLGIMVMGLVGHVFYPYKGNFLLWILYGMDINLRSDTTAIQKELVSDE